MTDQGDFKTAAQALREQLVAWRRDMHRHPELRFEEQRTASIVAAELRRLGYRLRTGIAQTGILAVLEGQRPGPVVMARFDMDALPITEENETSYVSQNPGVMHACGHDAHVAIGLGVATLAVQRCDQMAGTLQLVFQPAEEGARGAPAMLKEGLFDPLRPEVFLSTHVWNELPVGKVDAAPGPIMAAAEEWSCIVRGTGAHGAAPHRGVDPIVAAAQIVTALQTVVSRNIDPMETAVVTVAAIQGGEAFNIIPQQVEMKGTIRTFQPETRDLVLKRVREVIEGVAAACGAQAEWNLVPLAPATINDAKVAAVVRAAAEAVVGAENVSSSVRTMGSEDASFFLNEVPGCYFLLGSANAERGLNVPHHNPRFDIDEDALPVGVAVMMQSLGHYLFPG